MLVSWSSDPKPSGVIAMSGRAAPCKGGLCVRSLFISAALATMMVTTSQATSLQESFWFGESEANASFEDPDWAVSEAHQIDLFESRDVSQEQTIGAQLRLPSPLHFSRSFDDNGWRIDGVGFRPTPEVEIRATGKINSVTDQMQGDLSLRFQF